MRGEMQTLLRSNSVDKAYQRALELRDPENYQGIVKNLRKKLGGGQFHFFGSRMMGIGTDESDIDLFIGFLKNNTYYNTLKPQSEKFLIKFLYYKLKIDKCNWDVKLIVTNWHVPFIRAIYKPDNISVDISFQNGLAVETANLMHHLFDIQPEAAKLCLLMKKWLKIHKVVVKNYSLVLLVVFFLQQYNYLPSIKTVQKNSSFSTVIQGYECHFDQNATLHDYDCQRLRTYKNIRLIEMFFEFFMDFDFHEGVISPNTGKVEGFYDDWKIRNMNLAGPIKFDTNHSVLMGAKKLAEFRIFLRESWRSL